MTREVRVVWSKDATADGKTLLIAHDIGGTICVETAAEQPAALAPAPAPDDVALVDAVVEACPCDAKACIDHAHRVRTALLARFDAIRNDVIDECAAVADGYDSAGPDEPSTARHIAQDIRALKGK